MTDSTSNSPYIWHRCKVGFKFVTDKNITYIVTLDGDFSVFNSFPELNETTYFFAIAPENESNKKITFDPKVNLTVTAFIQDFFSVEQDKALVYLCDFSDGKQEARMRKFNTWYRNSEFNNELIKVDRYISYTNENGDQDRTFLSILYHVNHPQKDLLKSCFEDEIDELEAEKAVNTD